IRESIDHRVGPPDLLSHVSGLINEEHTEETLASLGLRTRLERLVPLSSRATACRRDGMGEDGLQRAAGGTPRHGEDAAAGPRPAVFLAVLGSLRAPARCSV